MSSHDIDRGIADDPDAAPILDADWFETARVVLPEPKSPVYIRLDRSVLSFFKELGPKYQTRINAVLKAYVEAQRKAPRQKK